jgi:hypothetical protein
MTPGGIEQATFRFVTQHLNHCATAVPQRRAINEMKKRERHFPDTFRGSEFSLEHLIAVQA